MKIIYYQDNICDITNSKCDRGSLKECPEARSGLEVPCDHFKHRENKKRGYEP